MVNPSALFAPYGFTANYRYSFAWPTNYRAGAYHLQSIIIIIIIIIIMVWQLYKMHKYNDQWLHDKYIR